jgi:hypothetical protein
MKHLIAGLALLTFSLFINRAEAEQARIACKNQFGSVTVRTGQCMIGEEFVKVMDNDSVAPPSQRARIACQNQFGTVTVRQGQCMIGEELVKVMD